MNIGPHMFGIYQQLLVLSQSMLRLASEGKWDELIDQEVDYVSTVEKLAQTTREIAIPAHTQDQLRPVLRHILDNEAEVKRMLQTRMGELSGLISQSSRQQTLNSAYGKLSGMVLFPHESN